VAITTLGNKSLGAGNKDFTVDEAFEVHCSCCSTIRSNDIYQKYLDTTWTVSSIFVKVHVSTTIWDSAVAYAESIGMFTMNDVIHDELDHFNDFKSAATRIGLWDTRLAFDQLKTKWYWTRKGCISDCDLTVKSNIYVNMMKAGQKSIEKWDRSSDGVPGPHDRWHVNK
jgi:hypothetical protein